MKQLRYWREKYMDTKKPVKTYAQFTDPKAVKYKWFRFNGKK